MNKKIRTFFPLILLFTVLFIYIVYGWVSSLVRKGDNTNSTEVSNITEDSIYKTYVVKEGDTIETISEKYGCSINTIADLNQLDYPYSLTVDQKLSIPDSE